MKYTCKKKECLLRDNGDCIPANMKAEMHTCPANPTERLAENE